MSTPTEFSYERDVAPYGSKFFNEIGNAGLSPKRTAKLQGTLLGGVEDIEAQRLKLQEERDQGQMRALQYQEGLSSLEEARARRARIERQGQQLTDAKSLVSSVVAGPGSAAEKSQRLAELELEHADVVAQDPDVSQVFKIGQNALPVAPKPEVTNSDRIRLAMQGVPGEVIERGNPDEIAEFAAAYDADVENAKVEREAILADTKDKKALRSKLLNTDLKFAAADGEEETWLAPESTQAAELIVEMSGTPEEKKKFASLKTSPSDQGRASLVRTIQLRELRKDLSGGGSAAKRNPSDITGL